MLVADRDPLVLLGVSSAMEGDPELRVVGTAWNEGSTIRLSESIQCDVVVVGTMTCEEGVRALVSKTRQQGARVLVLTPCRQFLEGAVAGGAAGFILRPALPQV